MAELTVRLAEPSDIASILSLFQNGSTSYVRIPIRNLAETLRSRLVLVATRDKMIEGAILSIWPYAPFAWLDAVTVAPQAAADEVVKTLLRRFDDHLTKSGIQHLLCSINEDEHQDLREQLIVGGFQIVNRFLRYEKTDYHVPPLKTSKVAIASASERDIKTMLQIEESCFQPPWRTDEARLRWLLLQAPHFRLARWQETIVGFQYSTIDDDGTGVFVHLAVNPACRGRQIGRALLSDALEFFQRKRVSRIETRTERGNRPARRLFTAFGFRAAGPHRDVLAKSLPLSVE